MKGDQAGRHLLPRFSNLDFCPVWKQQVWSRSDNIKTTPSTGFNLKLPWFECCTARIFCPVCKLQGTGNIEIASYSVSVQTLRFYHAFRDWNTMVGSNCCPFQLPKRSPVPQTSHFSYQNGAPFQLPKQAPFPKPPVSVTSVDLFPCLQSQLKNERGDPNLLVFPYLSSVFLVI